MSKSVRAFLFSCLLLLAGGAIADVESAIKGLRGPDSKAALAELTQLAENGNGHACAVLGVLHQNGAGVPRDLEKAFNWFKRSADLGHPLGTNSLARMHLFGMGTTKNLEEARRLARSMANLGDADGQFVLFMVNTQVALAAYQGADGKPDRQRYMALAQRPATDRQEDIEAYRALFQSAAQRHPGAVELLGIGYANQVGSTNRKAALKLFAGQPFNPRIESTRKTMTWLDSLGSTHVTPKLAADAMLSIAIAASASAGDFNCKTPQLKQIQIKRDLADAEYLPIGVPEAENFYLLKGSWDEEWTFSLCGKDVPVVVAFAADGMGGATYSTKTSK